MGNQSAHRAIGGLIVAATVALSGCGDPPSAALRIGVLVWPPYELAFLARDLGYLEGESIEFVDYESPATVQRAYRDGAVDALMVTTDYLLELAQDDDRQRVVLVLDFSEGGDALMVRADIGDLPALRGRRIGVERSALGAYVLHRVLETAGLEIEDVEIVPADIPDQERMYLDEDVDAVVTYEPIRSQLLAAGARELFSSRDIPGEIVDVLVTNTDAIAAHERRFEVFVRGWMKALRYLRERPREAAERMAPREGLSPDEFLESLGGVRIPDARENHALLSPGPDSLARALDRHVEIMLRARTLSRHVDTAPLLEPHFVEAARE